MRSTKPKPGVRVPKSGVVTFTWGDVGGRVVPGDAISSAPRRVHGDVGQRDEWMARWAK